MLLVVASICGKSQTVINIDSVHGNPAGATYIAKLFSDSLTSSFCIVIPKEVKAHKHRHHCEQVLVLEGIGSMKLAEKEFIIKKGDLIFIAKNVVHSVKTVGEVPLKVLSIQAPFFDGSDRIFVEENNSGK